MFRSNSWRRSARPSCLWLLLLLLCLLPGNTSAGIETIPVQWDQVQGATGYRIYVSPAEITCQGGMVLSGAPATEIDVGPNDFAGYTISNLDEGRNYWIAVKARNNSGFSAGCSNIIYGWPTPRVDQFVVSPATFVPDQEFPTWRVSLTINGHNFRPESQSAYTAYAGLEIVSYNRVNDRQLTLTLQYTSAIEPGEARVLIINHDGDNCDPRPEVGFTGCVTVDAGGVMIVPVLIPENVVNLRWWVN